MRGFLGFFLPLLFIFLPCLLLYYNIHYCYYIITCRYRNNNNIAKKIEGREGIFYKIWCSPPTKPKRKKKKIVVYIIQNKIKKYKILYILYSCSIYFFSSPFITLGYLLIIKIRMYTCYILYVTLHNTLQPYYICYIQSYEYFILRLTIILLLSVIIIFRAFSFLV